MAFLKKPKTVQTLTYMVHPVGDTKIYGITRLQKERLKASNEELDAITAAHRDTIFSGGYETENTINLGINHHYDEGII